MEDKLSQQARRAIAAEQYLQNVFRQMQHRTSNTRVSAVIHDLLLMEEMNEVLLKSISQGLDS